MITDISQIDLNGAYADYLKWQFDKSVELIKDKLYYMSLSPKRRHQDASVKLTSMSQAKDLVLFP